MPSSPQHLNGPAVPAFRGLPHQEHSMSICALAVLNTHLRLPVLFPGCSDNAGGGGQAAKDILGVDIEADAWIKAHPQPGSRELAQGLKVCGGGRLPPLMRVGVLWMHSSCAL